MNKDVVTSISIITLNFTDIHFLSPEYRRRFLIILKVMRTAIHLLFFLTLQHHLIHSLSP